MGKLFGNLFGGEDRERASKAAASGADTLKQGAAIAGVAAKDARTAAQKFGAQADTYAGQTAQDLGTGAQDFMAKQDAAARISAGAEADAATKGAARNAIKATRTAGMTPGQAALLAGQNAGETYTGALQKGLDTGRARYGQATELRQGVGADMANRELSSRGQQISSAGAITGAGTGLGQAATGMSAAGQDQRNSVFGGIGKVAGALGSIFSDSRMKWDARSSEIDELINKIKPVDFHYNGEDGNEQKHTGVMAQDLEKTHMGAPTVNDTPMGKTISAGKLQPIIAELMSEAVGDGEMPRMDSEEEFMTTMLNYAVRANKKIRQLEGR